MNRPTLVFLPHDRASARFSPTPPKPRPIHPTQRRLIAPCLTESGRVGVRKGVTLIHGRADPSTCRHASHAGTVQRERESFCDIKRASLIHGWVKHAATAGDADSQGPFAREKAAAAANRGTWVWAARRGCVAYLSVSANLLRRTSCPGPWAPRHSRASATDDRSWPPGVCGPAAVCPLPTGACTTGAGVSDEAEKVPKTHIS